MDHPINMLILHQVIARVRGIYELFPNTRLTGSVASQMCADGQFTQEYCVNILFSLSGANSNQLNRVSITYNLVKLFL